MDECKTLKAVNFDWAMQLQSVWRDSAFHTPGLHENLRAELIEILQNRLADNDQNPLGQVITGPAGAGKTHFLGAMRREVAALPAWFVLVDMTDVRDFWDTVLLGYTHSLQQAAAGNRSQFQALLEHLLILADEAPEVRPSPAKTRAEKPASFFQRLAAWLGGRKPRREEAAEAVPTPRQIAEYGDEDLAKVMRRTLNCLGKRYPEEIRAHQDALRALMLLNSNDLERSNVGYSWLQGMAIDEADRHLFGFVWPQRTAPEIVKSLSWLMSLHGPTLLAFDQLDAIVAQHHFAAGADAAAPMTGEQRASQAIIEGIADGLMAIRDTVYRTVTVLACLETSWEILRNWTLRSATDRFASPRALAPINNAALAEEIVTLRLAEAYRAQGFNPPYSSWPFRPQVFTSAATLLPRELLKRCEEHRVQCLKQGTVIELATFEAWPPSRESLDQPNTEPEAELDQSYEELCRQAPLEELLAEEAEDQILCELVQTTCRCLLRENLLPQDMEAVLDTEFPGDKNYRSLHARLRLIYASQGEREQHYCFRALQKTHAVAYQSRLNAALTASGIDPDLPFRKLVIIRAKPLPPGKVTREITDKFLQAKGKLVTPSEQDLSAMWALHQLEHQNLPDFADWLHQRRPAAQLQWLQEANLAGPFFGDPIAESDSLDSQTAPDSWPESLPFGQESPKTPAPPYKSTLPVGRALSGTAEAITIPLPMLTQYTGVLAGSGSGKTVLLKRLVEEAALLGISSIVIDRANAFTSLGEPWPEYPASWTDEDRDKAKHYHANTDVVIWTPGQTAGNPLRLEPLPDLAALADHPEELERALEMAQTTLEEIVAPEDSARSNYKMGVLTSALKFFALQGGKTLPDLIAILSNLPTEVSQGIASAPRFGSEMAQRLQAEIQRNPLLQQEGPFHDASFFFGDTALKRPKVSVISLASLPGLKAQQQFLNQLAMTLLTWIKRHPASPTMPVRGLLVMDEAKDFMPAEQSVPGKENLLRLADYAPTCGLGLVFATQAPKSIEHFVMTHCFNQFFGKASSPATIEAVQEQLKMRGGKGDDIPTLEAGHFYFYTESMPCPVKTSVPLCLSYHPPVPPPQAQVLQQAAASHPESKDR